MNERPTIREIAKIAEVHHSTVSRALKNDRRIPAPTRTRILKIAEEIGYRPDPMLSALIAYRQERVNHKYQATLAWVTNYSTRNGWKQFENVAYFQGAERRAAELGYKIEELWLREPGMTERRAIKILLARNIQGLLFIPQTRSRAHLHSDWARFSAISFGHTLAQPAFHNVHNDHFRSFALLMRHLKRLGYRRPGFACWPRIHESVDRAWSAAFWAYQNLPPQDQIPLFLHQSWTASEFKKWFSKYRPDVVITHDETVLQWLEGMDLNVPGDVGFVLAAKHREASSRCSGIDENSEIIGEAAVNVVVQMINRNENGIPSVPISTLVAGSWIEGETLKRQAR